MTPAGAVSTFVSSGLDMPAGLAFDAAGNLYVANNDGNTISKVTPSGAVSTFVSSGLYDPGYLAFDAAGNLFVSEAVRGSIVEVTPAGVVSTFVGSYGGLDLPEGLAFDAAGNLYVANYYGTISKVTPAGVVSTFVSSGLCEPMGLAFDAAGNLYVANTGSNTVSKVSIATQTAITSDHASGSAYGQLVTFTATVTPASGPIGTVQFQDNGTDIGSPVTLVNGTASYSTSALTAGSHAITAVYSGDSIFTASTAPAITQSVATAALTVTANSTSKTYGRSVTFAGTEFTTSGLVNGDKVTSVSLSSPGAAATAHRGRLALHHHAQRRGGHGPGQLQHQLRRRQPDGQQGGPDGDRQQHEQDLRPGR